MYSIVPINMATTLQRKVALVTGASRGIGASVARQLAEQGADIVINYRSKGHRAEEIAQAVEEQGSRALLAQADITETADVAAMMASVQDTFGHLDLLILNASGGMERDRPADYAHQLNVTAQVDLLDQALPLIPAGGRVLFVTSHLAHFHGKVPTLPEYEPVAASKRAGEDALRSRIPQLSGQGISLIVISGDVIEGTITAKLLNRLQRGLIEKRREDVGHLPTVEEFAEAIVMAAANPDLETGATIYVGATT